MQRYLIRRFAQAVLTLVALSILVFVLSRSIGDPVFLLVGPDVTQEGYEAAKEELGLDKPLPVQYWEFVKDTLRGDLGNSIAMKLSVAELIKTRFPATIKLAVVATVLAVPFGLMLGLLCAIKRNRPVDVIGRTTALLGQSLPSFWLGIMLILLFSVWWGVLPPAGMGGPTSYILPAIAMGGFMVAGIARLMRSSMLDVLASDYITFVRARGTPESSVILKHALKNAAIPVVTFGAVLFAFMLTGSIVVETVFAWPGLGRLAYRAIVGSDFRIIQAIVMLYGAIFIFINLLTDIVYAWLDPRIRY